MATSPGFARILVYGQNLNAASGKHAVNLLLQERELIVDVSCPARKPTWEFAGTLTRFIGHLEAPIVLESLTLGFDSQVIKFPPIKYPYWLGFTPAKWLSHYTLQIWKFKMPLYLDPNSQFTSDNIEQTVQAASTTAKLLLGANPDRKLFTIHNTSTGILYIGLDENPTQTNYSFRIPANGLFEVPINFLGEVNGVWSNNNGNAQITEFR